MAIPIGWLISAGKALGVLYTWLVKNRLRARAEELARNATTASVLRGSRIKLRWQEWPAARQLQSEGHGTIHDGHYETWVNVTPSVILKAMATRGGWHGYDA